MALAKKQKAAARPGGKSNGQKDALHFKIPAFQPARKIKRKKAQELLREPRWWPREENQPLRALGVGFQKKMQAAQRSSLPGLDLHRVDVPSTDGH